VEEGGRHFGSEAAFAVGGGFRSKSRAPNHTGAEVSAIVSCRKIKSENNGGVVRGGHIAEECTLRCGWIGVGVSPWPATDMLDAFVEVSMQTKHMTQMPLTQYDNVGHSRPTEPIGRASSSVRLDLVSVHTGGARENQRRARDLV
jgi:hypothetical protein